MKKKQRDPFMWLYAFFFAWLILAAVLYIVDWRAHSAERSDVERIVDLVEGHRLTVREGTTYTIVLTDGMRSYDIVDSILVQHQKQILLTIQGNITLEGKICWSVFSDIGPKGTPELSMAKCGEIEINLKRLPPRVVQGWYDERVREALQRLSHR